MLDLIGSAPVVALLGMCKNAGKTTAMNRLIRELAAADSGVTALTSIGRDGESRDLVTGTEKPPIYIYEGMLAATAEALLPVCDVSRELLAMTGLHTSLGEVAVFRARSDGFVQLAGPGIVEQLAALRVLLENLGADRLLIDGALSRRSPAAGASDGACILSTGASLDRDLDRVVAETAFAAGLLCLPEQSAPGPEQGRITLYLGEAEPRRAASSRPAADMAPSRRELSAKPTEGVPRGPGACPRHGLRQRPAPLPAQGFADFPALIDALRKTRGPATLRLSGALTEAQARALLQSGQCREGLTLLAGDGSRLLLRRETFEALRARGLRFAVLRGTRLAAITVNPVSAGGWRFDPTEFRDAMQAAVKVPVIDVLAETS